MNDTLNITEFLNKPLFECPVCKLPIDTISGTRTFILLLIVAIALWYFYLFILTPLLDSSNFSALQKIIISKIFMAIVFLLLALTLNFAFYLPFIYN